MKINISKLPNNLHVIFADTDAFPSLTCLLLVGAGSRYEGTKNNGIAHFFEHMAFKGSNKYPNAFALSSLIEGLGGEFNAFTDKDYTGYYVKAPSQHFKQVIDVLADMIQKPLLAKEEIEREKGVIVQEINMYEDTPQRKVFDVFDELVFKGSPLGMSIAGTPRTVSTFTQSTFKDYINSLYAPNNTVLIISGAIQSHAQYKEVINKEFHDWEEHLIHEPEKFKMIQKNPGFSLLYKKSEQAHICIGYRTFSRFDERKYTLTVLSAILGRGMSSRLFIEVRERRGLCYSISTYPDHYNDTGNMITYAGVSTDVNKVNETVKVIINEHEKLTTKLVSEEELRRAKELIKGRLLLSLEDTFNIAALFGKQVLFERKYKTVDEILKLIDSVTAEEVKNCAQQVITKSQLNCAVVGPFKSADSIWKIT
ncbi:hypothetical protein A3D06_00210 [Candidatus Roizmanbacteria bacterium RIFCSPHIGHO2_02_FULL_40_9]|uniref:Peptidase M16 n=2 Tax=Candidatus Roizmaniibacteriota TaxID=1752723 RepID=A0A1F7IM20_9BACT|nr:MAG: hypothetical protein A3D06_00210 [Candidatus Roizmanbacteria bacterium RIFCSPHIGHO2_02_FULL_40_9]OGK44362.1 MAG: hypothetical protein A2957_00240 [Candidatus Roizmanbacteria bacterium RIFCSPLOWO2_01_FULL_38_11]